jgi:hypothetical protein
MIHILHMLERRYPDRAGTIARTVLLASVGALLAGIGLLMAG